MANIATLLARILSTRYGRDMRQDLHDSIEAVNDDTETALGKKLTFTTNTRKLKLLAKDDTVLSEVVIPGGGSGGGAVDTVNGQTGNVVLDAEDVGALPDTTTLADLTQDSTHRTVTDAQITDWTAKVGSVNGQTGNVQLSASDVSALPSDTTLAQLPQSSAYRTVSDSEKATWNAKANGSEISAIVNVYGAKNLNVYPYHETTMTTNGVTFNDNGDGSITVNGATTSAYAVFSMRLDGVSPIKLKKGTYTLSGCPNKSGLSMIFQFDVNGETISVTDLGNGATFTLNADATTKWCYLYVDSNIDLSTAVTFYPMLRDARITDNTFVPYALTNAELSKKTSGLSNRNLLDNPWFTVNQRGSSSYSGADIYTLDRWKNGYGTVTVNSGYININNPSGGYSFYQKVPKSLIEADKVYTISVLTSGNNVVSKSFTASASYQTFEIDTIQGYVMRGMIDGRNSDYWNVGLINSNAWSINIKAMKLELGTESTLALDVAPNYTEELLKCQRYYYPLSGKEFMGFKSSNYEVKVPLPTEMRTTPTISLTGTSIGLTGSSQQGGSISSATVTVSGNEALVNVGLTMAGGGSDYNVCSAFEIFNLVGYLSAEL